jgi:hypothetical protein
VPVLINGSPEIDSPPVHPEKYLIQVPRLPPSCLLAAQLFGNERPELIGIRSRNGKYCTLRVVRTD